MAWPDGAYFTGGVVAYGDDEIHGRCIGLAEFIPAFAAQCVYRVVNALQQLDGQRVHGSGGLAAGAPGTEAIAGRGVQNGFSHDAARRVAGAQKKYVVNAFAHDRFTDWVGWLIIIRLYLKYRINEFNQKSTSDRTNRSLADQHATVR